MTLKNIVRDGDLSDYLFSEKDLKYVTVKLMDIVKQKGEKALDTFIDGIQSARKSKVAEQLRTMKNEIWYNRLKLEGRPLC